MSQGAAAEASEAAPWRGKSAEALAVEKLTQEVSGLKSLLKEQSVDLTTKLHKLEVEAAANKAVQDERHRTSELAAIKAGIAAKRESAGEVGASGTKTPPEDGSDPKRPFSSAPGS